MKTIFTAIILFLAFSIFAQSPEAFNYQGVARDLSNNPITNKDMGIKCSVVKNSTTGTSVYSESHAIHTNSLGLFHLEIGAGTVLTGYFPNINWNDGTFFLKIEIDTDNNGSYELLGASKLLSVPYALHAKMALSGRTPPSIPMEFITRIV